jgi:succinate-acetate transporter protein
VVFSSFFNAQRLLVVALSFFVSLLFGWLFYTVFARLKPFGMDLDDVNKSPIAVGIFLFGYEVFLGLIMYGSLMIPLG